MEDKNLSLFNETQTLFGLVNDLLGQCSRLLPDKPDVNAATIRSMNSTADNLRSELFNLQKLIDEYTQ